jgi:hypothetical protein
MNLKQMILTNLSPIGKQLAREADPCYHSIQREQRAAAAEVRLNAVREAYRKIKNNLEPISTLRGLMKNLGGEKNAVDLIIQAALGKLDEQWWKVNPETLLIEFQK